VVDRSGGRGTLWLTSWIAAVLLVFSVVAAGQAAADKPKPTPSPANTSSTDEITDMVMAAIEQNGGAAPTTDDAVPPPPG
jgi:hypothetical protein